MLSTINTKNISYLMFTLLLALQFSCNNEEAVDNDDTSMDSTVAYQKLSGNWNITFSIETEDCEGYLERNRFENNNLNAWNIDEIGNFVQTYDDDGTTKTKNGRWVFIEIIEEGYRFHYTSEFTSLDDQVYNNFFFEGNRLIFYEDECIEDAGIRYREGTVMQKQ